MNDRFDFHVVAAWGPRRETPDELAVRALQSFRSVQRIDPIFTHWFAANDDGTVEPLNLQHEALARMIAAGVIDDYDGKPLPPYGYMWGAYNAPSPAWSHEVFRLGGHAGSDVRYVSNVANFGGVPAQKFSHSFIDFDILRKILLALVEPFEPTIAYAFSATLGNLWPQGRDCPSLPPCCMYYLSPPIARLVTPPDTATSDRRADGSLLMAATRERFDTDNPDHMSVVRDMQAAVQPFNDVSNPLEAFTL